MQFLKALFFTCQFVLLLQSPAFAAPSTSPEGNWSGLMRLRYSSCDGLGDRTAAVPLTFSVTRSGDMLDISIADEGQVRMGRGVPLSARAFSAWVTETEAGITSELAFTVDRISRNRGRFQLAGTIRFDSVVCSLYYSGNVSRR